MAGLSPGHPSRFEMVDARVKRAHDR